METRFGRFITGKYFSKIFWTFYILLTLFLAAKTDWAFRILAGRTLGLWHNFGDNASYENMKQLCFTAFDNGITHFDLANNYGPEPGSAERNLGRILREELHPY